MPQTVEVVLLGGSYAGLRLVEDHDVAAELVYNGQTYIRVDEDAEGRPTYQFKGVQAPLNL